MKAKAHGKKFYLVYLIFFIVNEIDFATYADDNTPFVSRIG